jgi:hypothetical protein
MADDDALGEHIVIIFVPLAGRPAGWPMRV